MILLHWTIFRERKIKTVMLLLMMNLHWMSQIMRHSDLRWITFRILIIWISSIIAIFTLHISLQSKKKKEKSLIFSDTVFYYISHFISDFKQWWEWHQWACLSWWCEDRWADEEEWWCDITEDWALKDTQCADRNYQSIWWYLWAADTFWWT